MSDKHSKDVPLRVRLRGPGVPAGRILLSDLVTFGRQLQTAVDRVACVLQGEALSTKRGPRPESIRSTCALEVVALDTGSFELALDFRRDQVPLPGMDFGEAALEKLIVGFHGVVGANDVLPTGYDKGVLNALRDAGAVLDHGVEAIEFYLRTSAVNIDAAYNRAVHDNIVRRIRGPVSHRRTIEGRLLMADFRESRPKCRIHPSVGSAVECDFDESIENAIYTNLRSFVRVTGEAEEDPLTGRIKRLQVLDIETVEVERGEEPFTPDDFWCDRSVSELAAEQGITAPQQFDMLVGAAADLWEDDEDVERFVSDIYTRRREGREHEDGCN